MRDGHEVQPSDYFELRRKDGTKLVYVRSDFDYLEVRETQVVGRDGVEVVDVYERTCPKQVLGYSEYQFVGRKK